MTEPEPGPCSEFAAFLRYERDEQNCTFEMAIGHDELLHVLLGLIQKLSPDEQHTLIAAATLIASRSGAIAADTIADHIAKMPTENVDAAEFFRKPL